MEAGLGFRQTTAMVNQQRREEGRLVVGRSFVMLHFTKMQPKMCKNKKCGKIGLRPKRSIAVRQHT